MFNLNAISDIQRLQKQNKAFHEAKAEKKKVDDVKKQLSKKPKKKSH